MKIFYSLIISSILIFNHFNMISGYGESVNGYPNAQERENFNLINLVRLFPLQYKSDYMTGYSGISNIFTKYGNSVPPVYYDLSINQLARSHSQDMATNRCFQHDSCNGQSIWTRFDNYLTCPSQDLGENIAAGSSPFDSVNLLLCDETNGQCAPDNSGNDGHRVNIMSSQFKTMGVGWVEQSGTTYTDYLTQDFSGGNCDNINNPIYSAYHTFYPSTSIQFIAIFYSDKESVSKFNLIFEDGTTYDLPVIYGTASKGAFIKTLPSVTSCAKYYFSATTTDSKTYKMPETGYFQVSKSSSCDGWVAGNTPSVTEAPTTQPPVTEAPTTQPPATEAPTTQPPATEAPTTEAPTTQPPVTEAPTTQPPATEAPTTEAPTTQPPATEAPTTEAPTTQPPVTEAPTTEAPTTQPPVTEAPTTEAPTTQPPETEAPDTNAPIGSSEEHVDSNDLSTNDSSNETPIDTSSNDSPNDSKDNSESSLPTTSETSNDNTASGTVGENSQSSTTESSTTESSTTESSTTESSTTESPTTESPTTESPTTESPTTESPTTESPTNLPVENLGESDSSNSFILKSSSFLILSLISVVMFF